LGKLQLQQFFWSCSVSLSLSVFIKKSKTTKQWKCYSSEREQDKVWNE